jgi:aspartyl-tRNA(Asn)/glutamyl-tRNA(Gln) amidotransferase subunit A
MSAARSGASLLEAADAIRAGRLSPVTLVEDALAHIGRHDDALKSFVHVSDTALEAARSAEEEIGAGRWRGPLHGIPIALKDNYLTADMPTRAGTAAEGITFPLRDSAVAARLRAAGAILLGKTRMHEFAWGTVTPPSANPWDVSRVPGGSSGGSAAAVAAGLCMAAMGTDTGGSIRIPASLCGVVGLKPTFGRISRAGIVPHSWSLDHAGPLTRTVADAAAILQVCAGPDPADPASAADTVPDFAATLDHPVEGLRAALIRNHFFEANQPDVAAAVERAAADLAEAGMSVCEVELPNLRYGLGAIFAIELASSAAYHDRALQSRHVRDFEPDVRTLVEIGRMVSAADYLKAEQFRRVLMENFARVFEKADVVITPTAPLTAWRHGETMIEIGERPESALAASWRLTYPFNLTGLPAISLPCGFDRSGLPIGLQIASRLFDEATVLRVAHVYERRNNWWRREPPR